MVTRRERGNLSICLIVILTLLMVLGNSTASTVRSTFQLAQHQKFGEQLRSSLLEKLLIPFDGETIHRETVTRLGRTLTGGVAHRIPRSGNDIYQVETIFSLQEHCSIQFQSESDNHPQSTYPSSNALQAVTTCQINNLQVAELWRSRFNVGVKTLSLTGANALFATNGYFAVTQTLTVASDSAIISGGDIWIEELRSETEVQVDIISLTGSVAISTISPTVTVYVDAGPLTSLPPSTTRASKPNMMKKSTGWIEGIYLGNL